MKLPGEFKELRFGNESTEIFRSSSEQNCFLQLGADSHLLTGRLGHHRKNNNKKKYFHNQILLTPP